MDTSEEKRNRYILMIMIKALPERKCLYHNGVKKSNAYYVVLTVFTPIDIIFK